MLRGRTGVMKKIVAVCHPGDRGGLAVPRRSYKELIEF